jgi:hypothetical protein
LCVTNPDGAYGAIVDAAIYGTIVDTAPGAIVDAATCGAVVDADPGGASGVTYGAVVENMSGTSRKNMSSV